MRARGVLGRAESMTRECAGIAETDARPLEPTARERLLSGRCVGLLKNHMHGRLVCNFRSGVLC